MIKEFTKKIYFVTYVTNVNSQRKFGTYYTTL